MNPLVRSDAERAERAAHPTRLPWLDTLRVLAVGLVIVHHAGQPYGPTGGSWPISNPERAPILGTFFGINAAFGMPLLFLLSGFLVPRACDRKGPARFLRDRCLRLGVPLVVLALILFGPPIALEYSRRAGAVPGFAGYFWQTLLGRWHLGHLWFLADLLAYCASYGLFRAFFRRGAHDQPARPLTHTKVIAFTLALAVTSFVVRLRFPLDRWLCLFGVLPLEPAHFARDTSMFFIGTVAYRRGWDKTISSRMGLAWLVLALSVALLCFVLPLQGGGGLDHASVLWSARDAALCSGFCLGLPVVFRAWIRVENGLVRWARPLAYGAYLGQLIPLLALQLALARAPLHPLAKFAVVSLAAVPASFLFAAALRKVPGLGALL